MVSLPEFTPLACPGLQLPSHLSGGSAAPVIDSDGEAVLVAGGGEEAGQRWWIRRAAGWHQAPDSSDYRWVVELIRSVNQPVRWSAGSSSDGRGGWLLSGGSRGLAGGPVSTTEVWRVGQWSPGPSLPYPIAAHCQVLHCNAVPHCYVINNQVLVDDTVYIVGGALTAASLKLTAGGWERVGSLGQARALHACTQHQAIHKPHKSVYNFFILPTNYFFTNCAFKCKYVLYPGQGVGRWRLVRTGATE